MDKENLGVDETALNCYMAGKRRAVFMFLCCRWMADDEYVRAWITEYGGFRVRWSYDSWQKMYQEEHSDVLDAMAEALEY